MIRKLAAFIDSAFGEQGESEEEREHALRVATALLLVEVARADYADAPVEERTILAKLERFFGLGKQEARLLLEESRHAADHAAELQQFTRRLHERLSVGEKERVVEMLWQVAYADGKLDKHEDHLVRKIAALLYVPHSRIIRLRNQVRGEG